MLSMQLGCVFAIFIDFYHRVALRDMVLSTSAVVCPFVLDFNPGQTGVTQPQIELI